jgi:hypothetical protein
MERPPASIIHHLINFQKNKFWFVKSIENLPLINRKYISRVISFGDETKREIF